ncbi:hypothetical protein HBI56_149470 [Parastagonospora nodorum]|nr:hypothetical protein HBH52_069860 [Parastagonospora nodorum]KAH4045890.1 hypothetical protein HBH49_197010 [Parastagonospora nodorum]KAH4069676.1 hypothetical protein HBH50_102670 [Parastagonospora nodorum]KAH4090085.1 hypothetical protein HBH48_106450 [Parastagonospora nodorum]KAH4202063.1 hypothetical protein HBH42_013100 [Parastagonospora nodorum]
MYCSLARNFEILCWVYAPLKTPLHQSNSRNPVGRPHWPPPAPATSTHKGKPQGPFLQLAKAWNLEAD